MQLGFPEVAQWLSALTFTSEAVVSWVGIAFETHIFLSFFLQLQLFLYFTCKIIHGLSSLTLSSVEIHPMVKGEEFHEGKTSYLPSEGEKNDLVSYGARKKTEKFECLFGFEPGTSHTTPPTRW